MFCNYCRLKTFKREMSFANKHVKTKLYDGDLYVYIFDKPKKRFPKENWNRIYHDFVDKCTCQPVKQKIIKKRVLPNKNFVVH